MMPTRFTSSGTLVDDAVPDRDNVSGKSTKAPTGNGPLTTKLLEARALAESRVRADAVPP